MIYDKQPKDFLPDIEVVACLIESDGKILLLHRRNHKSQGGKWGIPAGKIDADDESKELALLREIKEETGLALREKDILFVKTFYVAYPDKNYFYHYYKANNVEKFDVIVKDDEHQAFAWVTKEEALNMPLIMHEDYCLKDFYKIK